jgi:hypothetical protein
MNRPFNIFPSIGYKNSQFQVLSTVDNLNIDIYCQDNIVKSIGVNSKYPALLTSINATGKLIARCKFNNILFEQEIEVKEAFRLGSSEFKKAFVFEDTDFSFFLMKDRLLLYDEKKNILLTENHYSPTSIYKINNTNFLFVTKVGNSANGIINLGIYNTETFSLVGELLNEYLEIKILPESNKAWLYNFKLKRIQCFELVHQSNKYFTELILFENFNDYFLDDIEQNLFINYNELIKYSNLINLHSSIEVIKKSNNAIDKLGNVFTIENDRLNCSRLLTNYSESVKLDFEVNFQNEKLIHIGNELNSNIELIDLNRKIEEIKDEIVSFLTESKTYYYHALPENKRISETITTHKVYPTIGGLFIIRKKIKRNFSGVKFNKYQSNWTAKPYLIENTEIDLSFLDSEKTIKLIDKNSSLNVVENINSMLLVSFQNTKSLFFGSDNFIIDKDDSIEIFSINEIGYFLIKSKEKYSLFQSKNINKPILENVEILNLEFYKEHQIIWFHGKEKDILHNRYLNAFDLKSCTAVFINEHNLKHSIFKDALDFKFFSTYALSSNQVVFNPRNFQIKDAFIGKIESHSTELNKIFSHRINTFYISKFNSQSGKYGLLEVTIDDKKYSESYLSPDGQFLVLKDEGKKYAFYDIEKNEVINFISGNFLAFNNEGNFIISEDSTRAIKIIDPKTFLDITPPNYHYYKFMSPDGKLYAQVSYNERYFHKINGKELLIDEVNKIREDLDIPNSVLLSENEKAQANLIVERNKLLTFNTYKEEFQKLGVNDYNKINSRHLIQLDKYIVIGIAGTDIKKYISIPTDTHFYNYAAYSYDNKYLGVVGKPVFGSINNSLIMIFSISFDESNQKLEILNNTISRLPRKAAWVCGFSKTGYFSTYDSIPDTFIIKMDDDFFSEVTDDLELKNNIYNSNNNLYYTYKKWRVIKDKNFLCFSPTGNFLALSEQGYEPLTLGGYGHQESSAIHIAVTESGEIINSYTGHGDKIKEDIRKKINFVAFSEDERRIMSLSNDGVVIIRDIKIGFEITKDKMNSNNLSFDNNKG